MNSINWQGLRYFYAAAETGSLSAAAKLLDSNQPTVGRYIDALEKELGTRLFQRSVKGLILTPEGQYILEQTKSIYHSVVRIERLCQADREVLSGRVKLSLPEGLALERVIPRLNRFYEQFPGINLIIDVSSSAANLNLGEADVALRLFRPEEPALVIKQLAEMKMGLYASATYKDSYGLPATLKDLKQHRVIVYGEQLASIPENQWLLKHSDASLQVLSSDSTLARLQATLAGVGISILPEMIAQLHPELVPLLNKAVLPSHDVWLVYHQDLRHAARVRAVVNFLSEQLAVI